MATNNIKLERAVSKGCPQGSCLGPGMWNIFYNSLLKLKFTSSTKIIAFADDLLLLTRGETAKLKTWQTHRVDKNLNLGKRKQGPIQRKEVEGNADDAEKKERKRGSGSLPKQQITLTNKNHEILGYNSRKKPKFREHITQATEKM